MFYHAVLCMIPMKETHIPDESECQTYNQEALARDETQKIRHRQIFLSKYFIKSYSHLTQGFKSNFCGMRRH